MGKLSHLFFGFVVLVLATSRTALVTAEQLSGRLVDASTLQGFFDEYVPAKMNESHVAGTTVAVVRDDRVIFAKGYGSANLARQIAVDPENTLFVLGSLSKVFVWTAVMQLVERGKVDLNADVNGYLDFSIPGGYSQAITLNHLMAHSAGFDDSRFGQMTANSTQMPTLGQWLKMHVPSRVFPPGRHSAVHDRPPERGMLRHSLYSEPHDGAAHASAKLQPRPAREWYGARVLGVEHEWPEDHWPCGLALHI